jgi:hypothetical protein
MFLDLFDSRLKDIDRDLSYLYALVYSTTTFTDTQFTDSRMLGRRFRSSTSISSSRDFDIPSIVSKSNQLSFLPVLR